MRTFTLTRLNDETGVSGTGIVVEGIEFGDGRVALRWTGEDSSIVIWRDIEQVVRIHMAPHPTNVSCLEFSDGTRIWQDPSGGLHRT